MSITFEERCRLIPFMAEAVELGLVTEADKEQVRSSQDGLIAHMYDCERRVNASRAEKAQAEDMIDLRDRNPARKNKKANGKRFGIHSLPGDAIKEVIVEELDFRLLNESLLRTVPTLKRYWELQEELKLVFEYHIYAAFWLGWQAAQHPEEWIFSGKGVEDGLSYASPVDSFEEKMRGWGYRSEEVWSDLDDKTVQLACDVMDVAEKKAFGLGWQSQADPSWIIFWREKEAK